ncbi:MAG: biotin carboxylase N-terminal domain-containing protein, partial [Dehalococcoidia bacterium]
MFDRVCIANRGEIAVRIARTCRAMGIATHALYSDADANALHVRVADSAARIGPPPVAESYLNIDAVIDAALAAGCDAIHPGYGLLSENPDFARACEQRGLTFVGPAPEHIALMGHKNQARTTMADFGMPIIPGTRGDLPDADLTGLAAEVGFPLIVKASRGGGGIGMAVVTAPERLQRALKRARSSSARAFGSTELYLERQIVGAHHVEVQILADAHGTVRHLGERECSIQRRHQKVIEETPAPGVAASLRHDLLEHAVTAMERLGYRNAGTVECLVTPDSDFYFLEMNTRLQVEHPVTELVTGLDLVEWQLRLASGERLHLPPDAALPNGHAIEARIYAEDPETLLPAPGTVTHARFPAGEGIRVDAAIESGDDVPHYYDPLIAKLIAWAPDRAQA